MDNFFSVIIPCYNAEKVIQYCLDSIKKSTSANYEIICVDDFSGDGTVELIKKYRDVKLICMEKNRGAAVARNEGAKHAGGNILLFIDSDVVIMADTIEKIQASFRENNADAIVGIYSSDHPFKEAASNYKNLHLRYTRMVMNKEVHVFDGSCVAIKKKVFDSVSGFDENIRILAGEDWDLSNRIWAMGYRIILDKDIPFIHRKHYTSASLFRTDLRKAFGVVKLMLRTRNRKRGLVKSDTAGSLPVLMIFSMLMVFLLIPSMLLVFVSAKIAPAVFLLLILMIFLCNKKYFLFMCKEKSFLFMLASMGLFALYVWSMILGFAGGILDYYLLKHKY
ncbi:GT2 family glycosyltransferase [Anaerobacterium chartisolvens]|uniref:GT2 family glycosyltransferase n=1 Tax=Anaerobacterium chartisolvens TaxID=1297424 RepID=A0A369BHM0_9FIRM|nr:glycosyltransferase [Anaerobacterium chartisolvens]RCX20056.1 GT2 family glycosyltransferase [Anaerobacterium chartisolvens]